MINKICLCGHNKKSHIDISFLFAEVECKACIDNIRSIDASGVTTIIGQERFIKEVFKYKHEYKLDNLKYLENLV